MENKEPKKGKVLQFPNLEKEKMEAFRKRVREDLLKNHVVPKGKE